MHFPKMVEITEVGPRDGLQNEAQFVPTEQKKKLIEQLVKTGVRRIETASFVHPRAVPQMADAQEIVAFSKSLGLDFLVLTPNMKALEMALAAGVQQIAVFVGASETFNERNIRRSIADSLQECEEMFRIAKEQGLFVRGYVSMCFSCPYEGAISYEQVARVVSHFVQHGVDEISIGDTNGQATPKIVYERFTRLREDYPNTKFIAHFHDTNGFAYANTIAALQAGITAFDSSVGGLGGCPFSPGATGNISTNKLVELMHKMGIATGIDEEKLLATSKYAHKIIM
ncbi:hydroxymethylglutaryl-CoA lyase [Metasolibacillus sp. FSL H7-0170]|uniref:hydroxymethylglutaryl-CoA lyase n=1 Tax=Metasolibacillus TaxID=2703677 RepID=UPI000D37D97F|nr:hydroxymethylglutaryl-CoA lyase [Metasolibacillus fluoroglycofenilyticus]